MSAPPDAARSDKSTFSKRIAFRIQCVLVLLAIAWLATLLGRFHWTFDLASHFVVQYCVLSIVLFVAAGLFRLRWTAIVAAVVFFANLVWIVPLYVPRSSAGTMTAEKCRLLSCNVLTSNVDQELFKRLVETELPNIVLMMEIDANWHDNCVRTLTSRYPYQYVESREDNFGIALLCDRPLIDPRILPFDGSVPSVIAKIEIGGELIQLVGTHPLPPMNHAMWQRRNRQLEAIADFVSNENKPSIVFGDLNCTSWSPFFSQLLRDASLIDSRCGFGIQASWPTHWWLSPGRIPIDHVLHTKEIVVIDRKLGTNIGSDHLPVLIDFVIPQLTR